MSDQSASPAADDMRIPTGDELYSMLMGRIEPDLTVDQLPLLDEKYKDETPEQAKARSVRYEKAFAEYDRQLADYLAKLQAKVRGYQSTARKSLENADRSKESRGLSTLEQTISSL